MYLLHIYKYIYSRVISYLCSTDFNIAPCSATFAAPDLAQPALGTPAPWHLDGSRPIVKLPSTIMNRIPYIVVGTAKPL